MWDDAEGYESYVGRWSRAVGPLFADWLAIGPRRGWLDVACGTGALLEAMHDRCAPAALAGIDRSSGYLDYARRRLPPAAARLHLGDAERLPFRSGLFDVVVSGLALNFMDAPAALAEQRRVAARGGIVGAYVWDYAGGFELVRRFWDAAGGVDAEATRHDPCRRFSICNAEALADCFATSSSPRRQGDSSTGSRNSRPSTRTGARSTCARARSRSIWRRSTTTGGTESGSV